jgi:hypothetical protein
MVDKSDREFSNEIVDAYIGAVQAIEVEKAIAEKIHKQIQYLK